MHQSLGSIQPSATPMEEALVLSQTPTPSLSLVP